MKPKGWAADAEEVDLEKALGGLIICGDTRFENVKPRSDLRVVAGLLRESVAMQKNIKKLECLFWTCLRIDLGLGC